MSTADVLIIGLFLLAYAGFVVFPRHKHLIALAAAAAANLLSPPSSLGGLVASFHPNILALVAGTLVLSDLFILSKVPAAWADHIIERTPDTAVASLALCAATGMVSIFLENVAALLLLAPVALSYARKAGLSPVPLIVGMTLSANLQGTATLIGDPPSMIMAGYERMTFNDFFVYQGRPSIFWFVEAGALASLAVLWLFFRRSAVRRTVPLDKEAIRSWVPGLLLAALVVALSVASTFDRENRWLAGTLCVLLALGGTVWAERSGFASVRELWERLDKETVLFLIGVFGLVAAFERTGVLGPLARGIARLAGGGPFGAILVLVAFSVAVSAFVDNVPYITVMLPVAASLAEVLQVPRPLPVFATVIGACLGGNITPFGATANIVATGLLRQDGRPVSFGGFVRIGLPFTLAAVTAASGLLWLVWRR